MKLWELETDVVDDTIYGDIPDEGDYDSNPKVVA